MPVSAPDHRQPFILHDVSRLVWRLWGGRHPTGIDRVCLAYLHHFADRSLAMLQWRGRRIVLNRRYSEALFEMLLDANGGLDKRRLVLLLARAICFGRLASADIQGRMYLNVGHTGLDTASLPTWLAEHKLRPIFLIHDLIPITHPQFCREGEAEKHERRMTHALASAEGVILNSAATGADLARFASGKSLAMPAQIVAHLGIDAHQLSKPALPQMGRPYFLAVGTIEARKNHMLLLQIWDILRAKMGSHAPTLVILGQRGWEAQQVFNRLDNETHSDGQVIELGSCDDAQLAGWIDGACAVLMPSHVEGYGLPVLEALARGTPVIANDLAVYREITSVTPLLLDPDNPEAWAAAIVDYANDGADRKRQISALTRYKPPTWEDHFALVDAWLAGFAGQSRPVDG